MKKILLFLILFNAPDVFGQAILSLTTIPANPTENDSIYVLAHCAFSAAPCDQHTDGISLSGSGFDAWALNCIGMLTTICYYTDSFSIGMLPPGNYTFHFLLNQGFGDTTCTPGIVPGPDSSFSFTVLSSTSSNEDLVGGSSISVYPNPVFDNLEIKFQRAVSPTSVSIYSAMGEIISNDIVRMEKNEIRVDMKNYKAGIYFLKISMGNCVSFKKIIKQ